MSSAKAPDRAIGFAVAGVALLVAGFLLMVAVGYLPSVTGQVYGDDPNLAILSAIGVLCFALGMPMALIGGSWILLRLAFRLLRGSTQQP